MLRNEAFRAAFYLFMITLFPLPVVFLKLWVALCVGAGALLRFNWEVICLISNLISF